MIWRRGFLRSGGSGRGEMGTGRRLPPMGCSIEGRSLTRTDIGADGPGMRRGGGSGWRGGC